jgi:hypothetical protein
MKTVTVYWEYEDKLREVVEDYDNGMYDGIYTESRIIDGELMFPYVEINGERYYLARVE